MKTTQAQIDRFLKPQHMAIAGVSRSEKKFGNILFNNLTKVGFKVLPINPFCDKIIDTKCYSSIQELPTETNCLLIATAKDKTNELLVKAIKHGITNIWVNKGSENNETVYLAESLKGNIIIKECIYMFVEPVKGVHKFHKNCCKLFGTLPK